MLSEEMPSVMFQWWGEAAKFPPIWRASSFSLRLKGNFRGLERAYTSISCFYFFNMEFGAFPVSHHAVSLRSAGLEENSPKWAILCLLQWNVLSCFFVYTILIHLPSTLGDFHSLDSLTLSLTCTWICILWIPESICSSPVSARSKMSRFLCKCFLFLPK